MGPDALRTAGIGPVLEELGHPVTDLGNAVLSDPAPMTHPNQAIRHLSETAGWARAIHEMGIRAVKQGHLPMFLGGDHSISLGSVPAIALQSAEIGRPQFLLWLDAHPDFHTLDSTKSGNLHGTPVAYITGQGGFDPAFPPVSASIDPGNVCMLGIRSVDVSEHEGLRKTGVTVHDMRAIDEHGFVRLLSAFLDRVKAAKGALHVSLDVDFLDPDIAPAVGTTVPGGATFREAHLVMEMLSDAGLATSLDLAELNPFLDDRGKSARLMVELTASLFGLRIFDRPNHAG